ncbi:MAG TPA: hypothetical protein PKY82_10110 [Pyrinomonadaceae bacterium]|nr:hypothetical protein [Pyrinomonadaceae bacterium]
MKKYYLLTISILILILSLTGFSDNLITDIGQESNKDPKFIIHGLFCFAWMFILVIQTNFIRKENYKTHQQLGIIGFIVAIVVVVSSWYIFVVTFKGWNELIFFAKANRFFMTSYAVLVFIGYLKRKEVEKHKRLIYLATLYMLEPILSRASGNMGSDISPFLFIPVVWNAFFLSIFVYDWVTIKRIHAITYLGYIWFYVIWTMALLS